MDKDVEREKQRKAEAANPRMRRLVPAFTTNNHKHTLNSSSKHGLPASSHKLIPMSYTPEIPLTFLSTSKAIHVHAERSKTPASVSVRRLSPVPDGRHSVPPEVSFLFQVATQKKEADIARAAKKLFKKPWVSPAQKLALASASPNTTGEASNEGIGIEGTMSVDNFHHRHFLKREEERSMREAEMEQRKSEAKEQERLRQQQLAIRQAERMHNQQILGYAKRQNEIAQEQKHFEKLLAKEMMEPNSVAPNLFQSCGAVVAPFLCGQVVEIRSVSFVKAYLSVNPNPTIPEASLLHCGKLAYFKQSIVSSIAGGNDWVSVVVPVEDGDRVPVVIQFPIECIVPAPWHGCGQPPSPMILSATGTGVFRLTQLNLDVETLGDITFVDMKSSWKPSHGFSGETNDLLYAHPLSKRLTVMSVTITVGDRKFKTQIVGDSQATTLAMENTRKRALLRNSSDAVWTDTYANDGTGHHDMIVLPIPGYDRSHSDYIDVEVKMMAYGCYDKQGIQALVPMSFPRLCLQDSTNRRGLQDVAELKIVYGGLNTLNSKTLKCETFPKTKLSRGTTNRTLLFAELTPSPWLSRDVSVSICNEKQDDFTVLCWVEPGPTSMRRDTFCVSVFPPGLSTYADGPLFRRNMSIVLDIWTVVDKEPYITALCSLVDTFDVVEEWEVLVVLQTGYTTISAPNFDMSPRAGAKKQENPMAVFLHELRSAFHDPPECTEKNPLLAALRCCLERHNNPEDERDDEVKSITIFTATALDPDAMRTAEVCLEGASNTSTRIHSFTAYQLDHSCCFETFWHQQSFLYHGEHGYCYSLDGHALVQELLQFVELLHRPVLVDIEIAFPGLSSIDMYDSRDITLHHVASFCGKYTYISVEKVPEHVSFSARYAGEKMCKKRATCLRQNIPLSKVRCLQRLRDTQRSSMATILHTGGHFREMNNDLVDLSTQYSTPYSPEGGMGTALVYYECVHQPKTVEKDKSSKGAMGTFLSTPSPGSSISGKTWPEYYTHLVSSESTPHGVFLTVSSAPDLCSSEKSRTSVSRKHVESVVEHFMKYERMLMHLVEEEASERVSFDLEEATEYTNKKFQWNLERLWITDQQVILERNIYEHGIQEDIARAVLYKDEDTLWREFMTHSAGTLTLMASWIEKAYERREEFYIEEQVARRKIEDHQLVLWTIGSSLIEGEIITHDKIAKSMSYMRELRADVDDVLYSLHVLAVWSTMRLPGELLTIEGGVEYLKWCLGFHRNNFVVVTCAMSVLQYLSLISHNQGRLESSAIVFEVIHAIMNNLGSEDSVLFGMQALSSLCHHSTNTRATVAHSANMERLLLVPLVNYVHNTGIMKAVYQMLYYISTQPQSHPLLCETLIPLMSSYCLTILRTHRKLRVRMFEVLTVVCVNRTARLIVTNSHYPVVLAVDTIHQPFLSGSTLDALVKCFDKLTGNTSDPAASIILETCAEQLQGILRGEVSIQWKPGPQRLQVLTEIENYMRRMRLVSPCFPQYLLYHCREWLQSNPTVAAFYVPFESIVVVSELPAAHTPYKFVLPFRISVQSDTMMLGYSIAFPVVACMTSSKGDADKMYNDSVQILYDSIRLHGTLYHPNLAVLQGWSTHEDVVTVMYKVPPVTAIDYLTCFVGDSAQPRWAACVGIFWEVLDTLLYLHQCGIVHRNIFLSSVWVNPTTQVSVLMPPLRFVFPVATNLFTVADEVLLDTWTARDDFRQFGELMLGALVGPADEGGDWGAGKGGKPEGCPQMLWDDVVVKCLGKEEVTGDMLRSTLQCVIADMDHHVQDKKVVIQKN